MKVCSDIMSSFPLYGFCGLVAVSIAVLLSMSTDFFVTYIDDILIPCQHDSVWRGGQCVCDNTRGVFAGPYCDECQCQHLGICTMTEITKSRWGCRCPSHQKWVGTLCDKCYAVHDKNKSSIYFFYNFIKTTIIMKIPREFPNNYGCFNKIIPYF